MKIVDKLAYDLLKRTSMHSKAWKNQPKVLVATYAYEKKAYSLPYFFKALNALKYENFDFAFVDNSGVSGFQHGVLHYLAEFKRKHPKSNAELIRVKRYANTRLRIAESQKKLWKKTLLENYDYLFLIECDILVPKNALLELVYLADNGKKPVIGGLYSLENQDNEYNDILCVAPLRFELSGDFDWRSKLLFEDQLKAMLSKGERLQPYPIFRVMQVGFGCTLFHKSAIEQTIPRIESKKRLHSDTYFFHDCLHKKLNVYLYPYLRRGLFGEAKCLEHYRSSWKEVKDY